MGKSKNRFQGGKLTVMLRAKNGSSTKIGVVWQKLDFLAKNRNCRPKKSDHFLILTMFWPLPKKSCPKKKVAFAQIIKGENVLFWVIFWGKTHF